MVVAVGGPTARQVSAHRRPARAGAGPAVHVLHVVERDIVAGEDAVDRETAAEARALLDACVAELRASGVPVDRRARAQRRHHADVADGDPRRAPSSAPALIVLGPDSRQRRSPLG